MKTRLTLCTMAFLILCTSAHAFDYEIKGWSHWDGWDKGLYMTACAAHGIDMYSTHLLVRLNDDPRYGDDPPYERNKVLGETPNDATLIAYWVGEAAITYVAAAVIPPLFPDEYQGKIRKALLSGSASVSIGYAHRNTAKFDLKLMEW